MGSLVGDGRLLMLGLVQVLVEAAVIMWAIFWVPALQDAASGSQVWLSTVVASMAPADLVCHHNRKQAHCICTSTFRCI